MIYLLKTVLLMCATVEMSIALFCVYDEFVQESCMNKPVQHLDRGWVSAIVEWHTHFMIVHINVIGHRNSF